MRRETLQDETEMPPHNAEKLSFLVKPVLAQVAMGTAFFLR